MSAQIDMFAKTPELMQGEISTFDTSKATGGTLVLKSQPGAGVHYDGDLTPYLREIARQIPYCVNNASKMRQLHSSAQAHLVWFSELSDSEDMLEDVQVFKVYLECAAIHCEFRTGMNVR